MKTMKKISIKQPFSSLIIEGVRYIEPVVVKRSCSNCSYFNYVAPQFDQPYPEFWCGKEHWCGISSSEECEALNEPVECVDFNARTAKE